MAMIRRFVRHNQYTWRIGAICGAATVVVGMLSEAWGAGVNAALVEKGLARPAKQAESDYDKVAPADVASCTGTYETRNGVRGLLIVAANGQPLRWLADTNGDGKIDQLSFFKNGIEVYRDIDSDYDDKIDQSRWLGTAGMRWGIDQDEDGTIDEWKAISAEEVSAEVVQAVRDGDADRFRRLLLSTSELNDLGVGSSKADDLKERIQAAVDNFQKFVGSQKVIDNSSSWASFGADKPGIVPAGTEESTADIVAYENAMAIVDTNAGPQQLMIGTLVKVGDAWRLLDVPRLVSDGTPMSDGGLFFASNTISRNASSPIPANVEKLIKEMEAVENQLKDPKSDKAKLHARRADIVEELVKNSTTQEDIQAWTRQLADQILAAVQSGEYPDGVDRLKKLETTLQSNKSISNEVSYVTYRIIGAEYNVAVSEKDVDYEKVQKEHLKRLEEFVAAYPKSLDSADAMIHLGLNSELTNDPKTAEKWYEKTVESFADTPQGEKAKGAILRLNLEGQEVAFAGTTLDGKKFTTARLGRPVLIHYWASWCGPCKADMLELRKLQTKYAKKGLTVVGVNADGNPEQAKSFLKANKEVDWTQLYEAGGLESRIAVGLGVLSLPVTILIDKDGKVAKSTSHYTPDLETLVERMLK